MKELKKISLKTITDTLTKSELKRIMAGSGGHCSSSPPFPCNTDQYCNKICEQNSSILR